MFGEYQAFLTQPVLENYLAAREALRATGAGSGRTCDWNEIALHCRRGRFSFVRRTLERLLPEWILSPRYHFYAGWVAEEAGDLEQVELERFQFQACLTGLLATGSGTAEEPYQVAYASDVRDILDANRFQAQAQYCVDRAGQMCDVVRVSGGREVWFDLAHVLIPLGSTSALEAAAK